MIYPKSPPPKSTDDWRVKDALETLMRAKQIERDPDLMKLVKKAAQERMAAVNSIANKPLPKG